MPEYTDVTYTVTLTLREDHAEAAGVPSEDEMRRAIYRGIDLVSSEDAIFVERQ